MIFRDLINHLKKSNKKDPQNKSKEFNNFKTNRDNFNMSNKCLKNKSKH